MPAGSLSSPVQPPASVVLLLSNLPSELWRCFVPSNVSDAVVFRQGLRVALADANEAQLKEAGAEVAKLAGEGNVLVVPTDVSELKDVVRLKDIVLDAWGEVSTAHRGLACSCI